MNADGHKKCIAVVGGALAKPSVALLAEEVGREIARRGAQLICGGLGGVMEAACRGANEEGGLTIGVVPSAHRFSANPFVDVSIASGMGEGRAMLIARSCDGMIALDARFGTLTELSCALQLEKPVVGVGTWSVAHPTLGVADPILQASSAQEAVTKIYQALL